MRRTLFLAGAAMLIAGCAAGHRTGSQGVTPATAVQLAAANPRGVRGTFEMRVRAAGRQDGRLYLNSETDYRDQRNLTLAVEPAAEAGLRARLGADPAAALIGKTVRVEGTAQRITVWFYADGVKTDKFYYQTHVHVTRGEPVTVIR